MFVLGLLVTLVITVCCNVPLSGWWAYFHSLTSVEVAEVHILDAVVDDQSAGSDLEHVFPALTVARAKMGTQMGVKMTIPGRL